jgi:hypothetical protein
VAGEDYERRAADEAARYRLRLAEGGGGAAG